MTDPIKAKIIELVPEIINIERGCWVEMEDGGTRYRTFIIDKWYPEPMNPAYKIMGSGLIHSDAEFLEILGRPITLADVLRAIPNKSIAINGIGVFLWDYEGEPAQDAGGYWDFSKDYDGQTEEVKAFIGKLIGVV